MSYSALARRLLISCPGDVPLTDLHVVQQAINRWNGIYGEKYGAAIIPITWNTHAAAEFGGGPQELLNRQFVDKCDICLALFANRLGTATESAESGTAEEIARMSESGRYVAVLKSRRGVDTSSIDWDQAKRLEQYLKTISTKALILEYANDADLSSKVDNILATAVGRDQGRMELQLQQVGHDFERLAEVWPRVESNERVIRFGLEKNMTTRDWYIVLANTGDAPAQNVTVRFNLLNENDSLWMIQSDNPEEEPLIAILAPHSEVKFPLLVVAESAVQVNCAVSWADDRGSQENMATLRRT